MFFSCHCEAEGRGNPVVRLMRLLRYARNDMWDNN